MRIAVFGLGYVGCVSAACLANMGNEVVGVDTNLQKLEMIRRGQSPIIEPGLEPLIRNVVEQEKLKVTPDATEAVKMSNLSMICVGTPSRSNGNLDFRYVERVVEDIGIALREAETYHVVAVRSTLLPGFVRERIVPRLESKSGKMIGDDFGLCVNPEFLREGTAIKDFLSPPFTLIGEWDSRSGDVVFEVYRPLQSPVYRLKLDVAAMVKYASNAFHALKVTFANEIGAICKELDVDSHTVMKIFCQDKTLNISAAYLQPGFAFGGSCLPKDLRALLYVAKERDIEVPVLHSVLFSNELHIKRAISLVVQTGKKRVALLGLSFKPGTDDLRESPLVLLAEALIGKGYQMQIYDEEVSLSNVFGRNREYIETVLPHINTLLATDLKTTIKESEVLIMGKRQPQADEILKLLRPNHIVIDLVSSSDWRPAQQFRIV
ncbi:MAG: nucleotide sugar dehydrogenase [Syntrophaceae bacterium]|nr:nucleotide sugar dehydrogenase [Syntrophaceae bacterium]